MLPAKVPRVAADNPTDSWEWISSMQIKSPLAGGPGARAAEGIRRGQAGLTRAAGEVANADVGSDERALTNGLLDAQRAARQVDASARALERAYSSIGSLIDTLA